MLKSPLVRCAALASASLLSACLAGAQNAAPAVQAPAQPADPHNPQLTLRVDGKTVPTTVSVDPKNFPDAQKYITREFGPGYIVAANMPVLLGDLDGDGLEDAVFIVTGGNPLLGAGAFGYTVLDPYDGYWSFGDPNLNAHITQTDPGPHYLVLISHDWRGEKAKAKYVFINLPFKQISLTPTTLGASHFKKGKEKKVIAAIATLETDGQQGAVFWNGKTYKFIQLGNVDE
ncbi:MAG TPA: hypothetical protein VGL89_14620 [Candidatus Koribacter sp.]|jgi:hypothetical protein